MNAGRKKQKNGRKISFFFVKNKITQKKHFFIYFLVLPKDGEKRKKEERERDPTMVITMASYELQRHLGWRMQSHLGQNAQTRVN